MASKLSIRLLLGLPARYHLRPIRLQVEESQAVPRQNGQEEQNTKWTFA